MKSISTRILGLDQTDQYKLFVNAILRSGYEIMGRFKENFNGGSCITNMFIAHQTRSCTGVYKDFCTRNQTWAQPIYMYGCFLSKMVHLGKLYVVVVHN